MLPASAFVRRLTSTFLCKARNFIMVGVPPTDRSPLVRSFGEAIASQWTINIAHWNAMMLAYTLEVPTQLPQLNGDVV